MRPTAPAFAMCVCRIAGLHPAQQAQHAPDGPHVVQRRDRSLQLENLLRLDRRRQQVAHVALARPEAAVREHRLESVRAQPIGQGRGLDRRAADVQSGNQADNAGHRG